MIIDKEAIELLERAVAEKGADYIDPQAKGSCSYTSEDSAGPGCIVGHAYFYAGATIGQLDNMDGRGTIDEMIEDGYDDILPVGTDDDALNVFSAAQGRQDAGFTWGVALEAARLT